VCRTWCPWSRKERTNDRDSCAFSVMIMQAGREWSGLIGAGRGSEGGAEGSDGLLKKNYWHVRPPTFEVQS
jgi:hypothetical protein